MKWRCASKRTTKQDKRTRNRKKEVDHKHEKTDTSTTHGEEERTNLVGALDDKDRSCDSSIGEEEIHNVKEGENVMKQCR